MHIYWIDLIEGPTCLWALWTVLHCSHIEIISEYFRQWRNAKARWCIMLNFFVHIIFKQEWNFSNNSRHQTNSSPTDTVATHHASTPRWQLSSLEKALVSPFNLCKVMTWTEKDETRSWRIMASAALPCRSVGWLVGGLWCGVDETRASEVAR